MTRAEALARGAALQQERRQALIEDYQFIGGHKMSARQAAARLGVSKRTVERYRAILRETS